MNPPTKCPRCNSVWVAAVFTQGLRVLRWECHDCRWSRGNLRLVPLPKNP